MWNQHKAPAYYATVFTCPESTQPTTHTNPFSCYPREMTTSDLTGKEERNHQRDVRSSNKRSFSANARQSAGNFLSELLSQPKRMRFEADDDVTDESDDEKQHQIKRAGYIKKLTLKNFMCHVHFELSFGPNMNFIIGRNGSGKSAILTGISVGLGAKATDTSRGSSIKSLIKHGKSMARIVVEIENDGLNSYEAETYGKSIFVERKLTRDGQTSYAIKSENGSVISKKKTTLDEILQRFFIFVNNPLSFLFQDKAREFIASSTEQSRFAYFAEGTNIQSIINNYEEASQAIHKLQSRLGPAKLYFKEASARFLEAERLYKMYKQSHSLRQQLEKLHGKIYWFNVVVQERKIAKKELELSEKRNEIQKIEQSIENTKSTIDQKEDDGKALFSEKKLVEEVYRAKQEEHLKVETLCDEAARKVQSVVSDLKNYKADMEDYTKQITRHKADLSLEQKKVDDANGGSKKAMSQKLELLKNHQEKLISARDILQEQLSELRTTSPEMSSLNEEYSELVTSIASLREKIASAEKAKSDRYAAFGLNFGRLMRDIVTESAWHKKPVGPVGCYVSVKQEFLKWSDLVNATLQRTLDAFVVCDEHDRRILDGHMQKNNIHKSIIVRKFEHFGFSNLVSSRYSTMLNALEFQDEDAKFTLIDSTGLEEIVICESISEAEQVTRDRAVKQAFCLNDRNSGTRLTRREGNLSRDPIFYSRDLRKLAGKVDGASFAHDLGDLVRHQTLIQGERRKLQAEERDRKVRIEEELDEKKSQLKTTSNLIFKVQKSLAEEGDYGRIASLNLQIELCENHIKTREGMSMELWLNLTDCKSSHQKLKVQLEREKKLMISEAAKLADCGETINRHLESIQLLKAKVEHGANRKRDVKTFINSLTEVLSQDKNVLEELKNLAGEQCARSEVSISETDTSRSITTEYSNIQRAIEEMDRQNEKPFEQVQEDLIEAKALKDGCEQTLIEVDKARVSLENELNSRFDNLNITIREKLSRAKHSFELSMTLRGFKGKLEFDFTKKKVITEVQTEASKDTRAVLSLSGGEKSFTQIAFLLSIWKVMKPRVCGLDEFDVFMDSVNRTIAIRLLVHELRGSVAQSIFITPQDIAAVGDLKDSEDVKIHKILPPRSD